VVAAAITDGTLGVDSAAVIVKELDAASTGCSASAREVGEATLVDFEWQYTVADLHGLARQVRDRLDEDGAEPRDELHHRQRSVRFIAPSGGMVRMVWDMPPEVAGPFTTPDESKEPCYCGEKRYPIPASVSRNRGRDGSGSSFLRSCAR
jgi:hypothetical protein